MPKGIHVSSYDFVALVLIAGLIVVAFAWNALVGISWAPSLWILLCIPIPPLGLCWYYSAIKPEPKLAQFTFYAGLWLLYPIFGTRLSYLAAASNFPLRDNLFQAWDHALGFDGMAWAHFVYSRPWLSFSLILAYASYAIQPFVTAAAICHWAPKYRNAELLTSVIVALIFTLALSALLPALTMPGFRHEGEWMPIVRALRSGQRGIFTYTGIITFPSFHTVMAILFTYANRGIRQTFWCFFVLNFLMLLSIPAVGYHYFVDVLAGVAVAGMAVFISHRYFRRFLQTNT